MSSTIRRTSGRARLAWSAVYGSLTCEARLSTLRLDALPDLAVQVALGLALLQPAAAALRRGGVAALLLRRLERQQRHLGGLAVTVQRDVGDVARVRVALGAGEHVLGLHTNADLHRRAADGVHARLHVHQLADEDRLAEVHAVHGDGDAGHARVPDGADRGGLVDHR